MTSMYLNHRAGLRILSAAFILVCMQGASAHAAVKVLFIGDSLSWGVRAQVVSILNEQNVPTTTAAAIEPAMTLGEHLHRQDTLDQLYSDSWDYVVLQEQSAGIYGSRLTDMKRFIELVRSVGAVPVLYMTSQDRNGYPADFNVLFGNPRCSGYCTGYMPVAQQMTRVDAPVPVAPAGKLFDVMRHTDIELDVFARDGHHLNGKGKLLVAMTIAGIVLDVPVTRFPIPATWDTRSTRQAVDALATIMSNRLLYNYDGQ